MNLWELKQRIEIQRKITRNSVENETRRWNFSENVTKNWNSVKMKQNSLGNGTNFCGKWNSVLTIYDKWNRELRKNSMENGTSAWKSVGNETENMKKCQKILK